MFNFESRDATRDYTWRVWGGWARPVGNESSGRDLTKTRVLGRNGSHVCTNPSPFILHAEYAKRVISFPNWCACPSWKQRTILERHESAATTSQAKASLFSKHGQSQIGFSVPRSHYRKLIPHRSIFLFCEIELKFPSALFCNKRRPTNRA